jgi:long-chain acyl-CoA synthetase
VLELYVPSGVSTLTERNTADLIFDKAAAMPEHVSLRRKVDGTWRDVTISTFADEVTAVAKGLIAAGINAGDRVAVMSKTRYEWTLVDFALFTVGAVVVPIYETSSAEQVEWILTDSGAVAAFVETAEHATIFDSARHHAPDLGPVWSFEDAGIASVCALGSVTSDTTVQARRSAVELDDVASIIYTSGTTGMPKGCVLTHRNFISETVELVGILESLFQGDLSILGDASTLLFLPIAHVFGRVVQIAALSADCALGHTADTKNLLEDLGHFRPTFVLAVPRVFEKVYNGAKQKAHSEHKGMIFTRAETVAVRYSQVTARGATAPLWLKAQHMLFDKLVYSRLRAALGGQCTAALSGGAPLGERLAHFFRGVGVPIFEGYGLTETTAAITVNTPDAIRIGTVGRPVPSTTVHVAEDGELLFKSSVVFDGYWRNDDATALAIDRDGWFHTGDVGTVDEDGFVRITGRKKELIVTANGKNVAPAVLEDRVRAHWLISQCLVVGDKRPFIAALVTIDPEAFPAWLRLHNRPDTTTVADLVDDPELLREVQAAVDEANLAVSHAESIRKFTVLTEDWTEAGGQITPSLKLKRNVVMSQEAEQIEALYASR